MRFSAMRAAVLLGGLVGVWVAGCGDDEGGTRIVVTVDSDIGPKADPHLTKVAIDVDGTAEPAKANANDLADDPLPRELTLLYGGGSKGPLRITATGTLSDDSKLSQTRGEVFFVDGEEVKVSLQLAKACLGVSCPDGQTCIDGSCEGEAVVPDGGMPEAGMDAGMEAGAEAGTEAGTEAGMEAGTDGGEAGTDDAAVSCKVDGDCVSFADTCLDGVCDKGACVSQPKADSTSCTDGLCLNGACVPLTACPSGTCNLSCGAGQDCVFDCAGADSCGVRCNGNSCLIDCRGATTCTNIRCSKGECLLLCEGAADCGYNMCVGTEMTCPSTTSEICGGRTCP